MDKPLYLARIETTSNQAYIFASRRLLHAIGGSYLLARSTTVELGKALGWTEEEASRLLDDAHRGDSLENGDASGVRIVTAVSGLAILLSDDRQKLAGVVGKLAESAAKEAPGLRLAGAVVGLSEPTAQGLADALNESARELALVRGRMWDATATLPLVERCAYSGLPAESFAQAPNGGDAVPVSGLVAAQDEAAAAAKGHLAHILGVEMNRLPRHLTELDPIHRDPDESRWMAVVHADGNSVGKLFQAVGTAVGQCGDLESAIALFRRASVGLDAAVGGAVRAAVQAVYAEDGTPTILPLIVGGDDITFVALADRALDFTRELQARYRAETERWGGLLGEAGLSGQGVDHLLAGLTLAAGVAFTKLHHPITDGLRLAEELTTSAKASKAWVPDGVPPSTLDLHVLMDSSPVDLATIRARRAGGEDEDLIALAGGPYVVGDAPEAVPALSVDKLDAVMETLAKRTESQDEDERRASRSGVQRVREALFRGRAAHQALKATGGLDLPDVVWALDKPDRVWVSPLIDAIELTSMEKA